MSRKKKPSNAKGVFDNYNPNNNKPVAVSRAPLTVKSVSFKTQRQREYYDSIMENTITVSTGVAGTGKSFIAVFAACQALQAGDVDRIVMTKPTVEVGDSIGFLPGDADEKLAPYIRSIEECFIAVIGEGGLTKLKQQGKLEVLPLNYIRGMTLDNCFVIADEMQNSTYDQMKALLTRIGEDAVYVINGDLEQSDLKKGSGLPTALTVLDGIEGCGLVEFGIDDIVRSGMCREIIIGYHNLEKN